jgi:hypothetical protein
LDTVATLLFGIRKEEFAAFDESHQLCKFLAGKRHWDFCVHVLDDGLSLLGRKIPMSLSSGWKLQTKNKLLI